MFCGEGKKKTERKNTKKKNNQSLKKGGEKKQVLIETWKQQPWMCGAVKGSWFKKAKGECTRVHTLNQDSSIVQKVLETHAHELGQVLLPLLLDFQRRHQINLCAAQIMNNVFQKKKWKKGWRTEANVLVKIDDARLDVGCSLHSDVVGQDCHIGLEDFEACQHRLERLGVSHVCVV